MLGVGPSLLFSLARLPSALSLRQLKNSVECSGGNGAAVGESPTCSLGHDHLGFAASTVALHGVGGYRDGVGGLGLQVCDDHLLQAGVAVSDASGTETGPAHPHSPGWGQARSAGRGVHPSSCTDPDT